MLVKIEFRRCVQANERLRLVMSGTYIKIKRTNASNSSILDGTTDVDILARIRI